MNYKGFGSGNPRTIVLLHGSGLSWWNYCEEAELLQNEFHVVVPLIREIQIFRYS